MYTRIRTPVNVMTTEFSAMSTLPRATAATGSGTRCALRRAFGRNRFARPVNPSAEASSAPAGCLGVPAGVYVIVLKTFSTNSSVPTITAATPPMKIAPASGPNCEKSAGSGQYSVYSGA